VRLEGGFDGTHREITCVRDSRVVVVNEVRIIASVEHPDESSLGRREPMAIEVQPSTAMKSASRTDQPAGSAGEWALARRTTFTLDASGDEHGGDIIGTIGSV
jgi:hypothetical protein